MKPALRIRRSEDDDGYWYWYAFYGYRYSRVARVFGTPLILALAMAELMHWPRLVE